MKKILLIGAIFLLMGLVYNPQPKDETESKAVRDGIDYFYQKIGSIVSIPYKDVQAMFHWGYKKLTGKQISQQENIRARQAFARTGVPATFIITILSYMLYRGIKERISEKRPVMVHEEEIVSEGAPPFAGTVPTPGLCLGE